MPVGIRITIKNGAIVRRGLENLRKQPPLIARKRIYDALLHARTLLRKPAAKPTYPIRWDSERQRRAYFASDGFGSGIPYRRTGRYERGWTLDRTGDGYAFGNPVESALHVGGDEIGDMQSLIHRGRWPLWIQVVERQIAGLPKTIEAAIQAFFDREAFS